MCLSTCVRETSGERGKLTECEQPCVCVSSYVFPKTGVFQSTGVFSQENHQTDCVRVYVYACLPVCKTHQMNASDETCLCVCVYMCVCVCCANACARLHCPIFFDTGFHGRAPIVEFCYRQGQVLNVRGMSFVSCLFVFTIYGLHFTVRC